MKAKIVSLVAVLFSLLVMRSPAHAGGVVTVCDEAHLRAALAGGGIATFACSGTITLTGTITIETDTTIDGSGQAITISGNHRLRPFKVAAGAALNLNMLTVAHGRASGGSGIGNFGTLTVTNCVISDNEATSGGGAGIGNYHGTVTIINSVLWGNTIRGDSPGDFPYGGGIYNDGALTVIDSTFSNNYADWAGGGIYSTGTLTVIDSTFSGNGTYYRGAGIFSDHGTATVIGSTFIGNRAALGAGIDNYELSTLTVANSTFSGNRIESSFVGYGGGILNENYATSVVTVTNSTFVGNSTLSGHSNSGGAGLANFYHGTLTVINSTIAGNSAYRGGGFYTEGTMTIKNTIVANNPSGNNCGGFSIIDGGGNLSFPDTTCPGISADPMLGPLQNNGGPTGTMALLPGSAARDAGLDDVCAAAPVNNFDQRGALRPVGEHCDIGAFEAGAEPLPIRSYFPYIR